MARGGARAGAGRPKSSGVRRKPNLDRITVRFPGNDLAEIAKVAAKSDLTRGEWIVKIVQSQLQIHRSR